jgi:hypothetical protein
MWAIILSAVFTAGPEFQAPGVAGPPVVGSLVELSAEHVVLKTPAGPKDVGDQAVELIAHPAVAAPAEKPTVWVELTDRSLLVARQFNTSGGQAKIELLDGRMLDVPIRALAAVRFFEPASNIQEQWAEIEKASHTGDTIVIRKQDVLDYLSGNLGDVAAETAAFTVDGEKVDVKRRKIAGILYAASPGRELPRSVCTLVDASGSRVEAAKISLAGDRAQVTTPAGVEIAWPMAAVARIGLGRVQFLSDLVPESVVRVPFVGAERTLTQAARLFYSPRFNRPPQSPELSLLGKSYAKGLAIQSRTVLVFRLPGKFRSFRALAGIDDAVRPDGNVKLQIFGDERPLFEAQITGRDRQAVPLNLDLTGVNRLKIVVDFNGDEVSDHLDLCEARILQ